MIRRIGTRKGKTSQTLLKMCSEEEIDHKLIVGEKKDYLKCKETDFIFKILTYGCKCKSPVLRCQMIFSSDLYGKGQFDCDYALEFYRYFNTDMTSDTVFKEHEGKVVQVQDIMLKDDLTAFKFCLFAKSCEDLGRVLGTKYDYKFCSVGNQIKKVHEKLRKKLRHYKTDGLQVMMASYLYELLPELQEQL